MNKQVQLFYLIPAISDADEDGYFIFYLNKKKGASPKHGFTYSDSCFILVSVVNCEEEAHLSVQLCNQSDLARLGVDPEVFLRPFLKGQAVPDTVSLRICTIQSVHKRSCGGKSGSTSSENYPEQAFPKESNGLQIKCAFL